MPKQLQFIGPRFESSHLIHPIQSWGILGGFHEAPQDQTNFEQVSFKSS